ncbi:MAG: hypothetical protein BWK80_09325 [Desulfobacteraceae bacterium IS3]|nr:MAG: hypothetical protein BWK80_09325 [Desulfobacteraceae bacterium IS3]
MKLFDMLKVRKSYTYSKKRFASVLSRGVLPSRTEKNDFLSYFNRLYSFHSFLHADNSLIYQTADKSCAPYFLFLTSIEYHYIHKK